MRYVHAELLLAFVAGLPLSMPAPASAAWAEAACGKLANLPQIDDYEKRTGCLLGQRLLQEPTLEILIDLAELRGNGKDAGPIVQSLLDHDDRDLRLAAARTLGFIEFEPSVDALIALLDHPNDNQMSWVAAQSLGRMRAGSSSGALQRVAGNHRSESVRRAALEALQHFEQNSTYIERAGFASEFRAYGFVPMGKMSCEFVAPESARRSTGSKRHSDDMPREVLAVGEPWSAGHGEMTALRVGDGWLAGIDHGEWGGQLVYIKKGKKPVTLVERNIADIHRLGDRIVAVTGLAHMDIDEGMIYEARRRANGEWVAVAWQDLPSAPRSSWVTDSGDLSVNVAQGRVLVSRTGTKTFVPCPSK